MVVRTGYLESRINSQEENLCRQISKLAPALMQSFESGITLLDNRLTSLERALICGRQSFADTRSKTTSSIATRIDRTSSRSQEQETESQRGPFKDTVVPVCSKDEGNEKEDQISNQQLSLHLLLNEVCCCSSNIVQIHEKTCAFYPRLRRSEDSVDIYDCSISS